MAVAARGADVGGQGAVPPLPLLPLQPLSLLLDAVPVRGAAAAVVEDLLGRVILRATAATSERGLKWP